MKKLFIVFILFVTSFVLAACNFGPKLSIFLPNEYISEDLLIAFEKETGLRVSPANFDSNEQALSSLARASYDLVIPSDYAIEELAAKDQLLELDWSKLDGFNKETDFNLEFMEVIDTLKEEGFDLLKYSAPYFWGNLGIVYDNRVNGLEQQITNLGWNSIVNSNNDSIKRVLYDSSRDAIFVALKAQGISLLGATTDQIKNEAKDFLTSTRNNNTYVLSDQILYDMIDSNNTLYNMAVAYSGDAVYLTDENEHLGFIVPHQGTNVFIDGFVIPKNSKNIEGAYQFINFMYEYNNAYDNSVEIGYTSPISQVFDDVMDNDYEGNNAYIVTYNVEIDEFFRYDESKKSVINNVWNQFKAGN